MNPYTSILLNAKEEVNVFKSSETGNQWEDLWYDRILDLVDKISSAVTAENAERYLDMLLWSLVDSGPLSGDLSPAINSAADAMQRLRKQRHITN